MAVRVARRCDDEVGDELDLLHEDLILYADVHPVTAHAPTVGLHPVSVGLADLRVARRSSDAASGLRRAGSASRRKAARSG